MISFKQTISIPEVFLFKYTRLGFSLLAPVSFKTIQCVGFSSWTFLLSTDRSNQAILVDQVYYNARVPTQVNPNQQESTQPRHESTRVQHESIRIKSNMIQHEFDTIQQSKIGLDEPKWVNTSSKLV